MPADPPRRLAEPPTDAPFPPPVPWAGRTFAAFRNRNYRLFFLGQGLSMVGSWGRSTAQGWLVYELTSDKRLLGAVSAFSLLPLALLAAPAGALADRVDRRRLLVWIQVFEMVLSATLAADVLLGSVKAWHVVALAAAMGVASGFEMPCRQAFMLDMVGREHLRNAIALNSAMFNLALILGPAVAAEIMHLFGIGWVFVLDAVSFLAAVAGFALMRVPARAELLPRGAFVEHLLEGVRYVRGHRVVRTLMGLLAVAMLFGWGYASLLAAFARDVLGEGERGYGLLYASSGVGACVGAVWVAGRHGARPGRVVLGSLAVFALSLLGVGLSRTLLPAALCRAVAGFAMIAFFSTSNTTIQVDVPDALRGRVMGLWALVFGGSLAAGQLLLGFVAERVGTPWTFAAGAAVCLAATAAVALARPFKAA